MAYHPDKHHRRSIRLKGYDYGQAGLYFVTLCCYRRRHLFGQISGGKLLLNQYGQIAHDEWLRTEKVRENIRLHEFVIMPNHMHSIIEITFSQSGYTGHPKLASFSSPSQTVGAIVRGYKGATTKKIKILSAKRNTKEERKDKGTSESGSKGDVSKGELRFAPTPTVPTTLYPIGPEDKVWQRNYFEHIIRDETAYHNIAHYIQANPLRWKEDKFFRK